MKVTRIFFGVGILLAGMLTTACQDDLAGPSRYDDGYLHFKFSFDENGQWNDDGTSRQQTRLMAPVELSTPDDDALPLYLHCEESNYIETATPDTTAVTRGERLTGNVFDSRNKIKSFGLYARVGANYANGEEVLPINSEIIRDNLTPNGDWQVKEQELTFSDENDMWTNTKKGYFYGFAPFPGYDSDDPSETGDNGDYGEGHARCITVDESTAKPTITFTMQPEERKNKDILTAMAEDVSYDDKSSGVELTFRHVLTAVKFKLYSGHGMLYSVGIDSEKTDYYIYFKSVTLKNIYREGYTEIGKEFTDENRLTYWNYEKNDDNIGDCTTEITRTRDEILSNDSVVMDANCFMVLPQKTPASAKLSIKADLYTSDGDLYLPDATFEAELGEVDWKAGYTYTYSIKKDKIARSYTLTAADGSTALGNFTFDVAGGAKTFQLVSQVQEQEPGGHPYYTPASWHVEYKEEGDTDWKLGLPTGYTLRDAAGNYVGLEKNIPGNLATSPGQYTLAATARTDGSSVVGKLQSQHYVGGPDGYYDLSTHGIGYDAAQTARNTANCYLIAGYGKFKLPLVYGNAIKNGVDNPISYAWHSGKGVFINYLGNDITNPYINADTNTEAATAEVLWQDQDNIVRTAEVYTDKSDDISGTSPTKYKQFLRFEILQQDIRPGNLVLCVKDESGNIMWSWHIWVTVQDFTNTVNLTSGSYSMDIAKYNIGWRDPEIIRVASAKNFQIRFVQNSVMGDTPIEKSVNQGNGVTVLGGSNLCYQFGRKDPFPNSVVDFKTPPSFDSDGKIVASSVQYQLVDVFKKLRTKYPFTLETGRAESLSWSIKNPRTMYGTNASTSNPNWYWRIVGSGETGKALLKYWAWDPVKHDNTANSAGSFANISKTIFDPSPVGFVVPGRGLLEMLNTKTWNHRDTTHYGDVSIKAPIPYIESSDKALRIYKAGLRRKLYSSGYDSKKYTHYQVFDPGYEGYNLADFSTGYSNSVDSCHAFLWTAVPTDVTSNKEIYGFYVGVNNSGSPDYPLNYAGERQFFVAQAMPVRPVVDHIENVEAHGSLTAREFKQVDIKNVKLTRKNSGSDLKWGLVYTSNSTLADFVTNSTYDSKKVYISNIKVVYPQKTYRPLITTHYYYGYNGKVTGTIKPLTYSDFYTKYEGETYGGTAWTVLSTVDEEEHIFSNNNWERLQLNLTDWTQIVNLAIKKMDITDVYVDLRITYTK